MPFIPSTVVVSLVRSCLLGLVAGWLQAADVDWPEYLGGPDRDHYSALTQINRNNVGQLQVAWEYHTGSPGEMQCNPLVVDGTLYGVTADGAIFALDAATGEERWRIIAPEDGSGGRARGRILRGVTYWRNGDDQRICFTAGQWLHAVEAGTGEQISSFGDHGRVSLKSGLGASAQEKWVVSTTPGTVFGNLIIMPLRVSEGADSAPGFIQAFDVRTGALVWTFRTIPAPGNFGYDTWPADAHRNANVGGANSWAGMAIDHERGLLFVPTGSAAPDFWGGARVGANYFANCLIALDARTGRRAWHFQLVHHDLWDRDPPAPPNLVTVQRDGRRIDAVAQVTKSGHVFVFDRETGEPLFPVEERRVVASPIPGETAWPTQPVPVRPAPFARQSVTVADINPYAENRDELIATLASARTGPFQPFGLDTTILLPGFDGGAEWGGAAVDRAGVLYVNANEMAWLGRLQETPREDELAGLSPGRRVYAQYCVPCHGANQEGNPISRVPTLAGLAEHSTRDEVMATIASGKGMMPGFTVLSADDRAAVADHLLGREKEEGPIGVVRAHASAGAPYKLKGYVKFVDAAGHPAIRPPWGTLTAIDLNTGEHRWRIPLGQEPGLSIEETGGLTGTENYGGPVVTASGLVFIAATKDSKIRAFDADTGALAWEATLPAPGFATPSIYSVQGRQFVVVAAGGTKLGTPSGDSYIAYALPTEGPEVIAPSP